jgi:hypothetical protein
MVEREPDDIPANFWGRQEAKAGQSRMHTAAFGGMCVGESLCVEGLWSKVRRPDSATGSLGILEPSSWGDQLISFSLCSW